VRGNKPNVTDVLKSFAKIAETSLSANFSMVAEIASTLAAPVEDRFVSDLCTSLAKMGFTQRFEEVTQHQLPKINSYVLQPIVVISPS
jgi:hypothetical protein